VQKSQCRVGIRIYRKTYRSRGLPSLASTSINAFGAIDHDRELVSAYDDKRTGCEFC